MTPEDKERLDRIREIVSITDIDSNLKLGNGNSCPACHREGRLTVWPTHLKCWRSSCLLNKPHNVFMYYQFLHNVSFWEAVKSLETKHHLGKKGADRKERSELMEKCLQIYSYYLWTPEGEQALQYLKARGFTEEVIKGEEIGFAPNPYCLRNFDLASNDLKKEGLLYRTKEYYDNRIIFPIRDINRNLVHFVGRYLGDVPKDEDGEELIPRYKDSRSNTVPNSKNYLAFESDINDYLRSSPCLFIAEGYPDALSLRYKGLPAVGVLGLEKLSNHAPKLKGFKKIICVFDNDTFPADHPNYPFEYKSWRRILPQLIDLQMLLPQTEFTIWMVPEKTVKTEKGLKQLKDVNDWIVNEPHSKDEILQIIKENEVNLVDELVDRWGSDLSKHQTLLKLLQLTNKSSKPLEKFIPAELSSIQYAMQVLTN